MYEATFEQLKQKTMKRTIDETIDEIVIADQQNFSLQSYLNEIEMDIELFDTEIGKLKEDIHKLKMQALVGTKRVDDLGDEDTALSVMGHSSFQAINNSTAARDRQV